MSDTASIDDLMDRAKNGDESARHELLELYRQDLRRMVAARLDRRIGVRVDASDVVQDALFDAWRRMDDYLTDRPLPFLAWLRQITSERIIDTHRRHITSQHRGIQREIAEAQVTNESAVLLAGRLFANDTSPSNNLIRKEFHVRLREAIISLPAKDREILLMRHIDQLDSAEIATSLGISPGAVKARLLRALLRLRRCSRFRELIERLKSGPGSVPARARHNRCLFKECVAVADDRLRDELIANGRDAGVLADGRADRHDFDEAGADLVDEELDANHRVGLQLLGLKADVIQAVFAGIVNQAGDALISPRANERKKVVSPPARPRA